MRRRALWCLTLTGLLGLVAWVAPASALVVQITSSVAANTSWGPSGSGAAIQGDVFWVRNTISVNGGVTLTLYPGTVVKFDPCVVLYVSGSLQANGQGGNQIQLTSIRDDTQGGDTNGDGNNTVPAPSDWGGITIASMTPDSSRFVFCNVGFAGCYQRGALQFLSGISGAVTDCTIRRSYTGLECQGNSSPVLVGTSIQTSTLTPIIVDFTSTPAISNLAFSGGDNGYDAFGLRGGTLNTTATLTKRGATVGVNPISNVTYVLLNSLTINSPGSLTISPGVVIKPLGQGLYVNGGGNLTMNGTVTDTVTVTSINDDNFGQPRDTNNNGSITHPGPGDWDRIVFAQGATGSLQYCRLKFGTNYGNYGLVDMTNQSIGISNTLLSDAAHGVVVHGTGSPPLNTVAINNMTSTPILMSVSATPIFTGITFQTNKITALGIIGEQIGVNSHLTQRTIAGFADITYYLMNGMLEMLNPAVLTIDPGVVLKFQLDGSGLIIDGGLIANGNVSNPIVFTSERDDLWGNPGDTNGDGSSTAPATADWVYIHFTSTAVNAQCQMSYCRLLYASYAYDAYPPSIWMTSCAPTISNCIIDKSNYGFKIDGNASPMIGAADTVQHCSYAPIAMSVQSDPTFSSSNIYQANGINGLALISETLSQNSLLKYRPQVTFPPPSTTVYPYVIIGGITIPAGVTLSIQPQVVIKVYSANPAFSVNGSLNAVGGTGVNQIVFTSYRDDSYAGDTNNDGSASSPAVGDWYGALRFNATSNNDVIRNCLFQFGGAGGPNSGVIYTASASPKIAASTFMLVPTALTFDGNSAPSVDSVSILNFTSIPIAFSLISNPSFAHMSPPYGAIQGQPGNSYTVLGILGETYAQDVHSPLRTLGPGILTNMAYAPTGTIDIAFGAKWTIDPGVVIKLGRYYYDPIGTSIQIDGALVANGTPSNPIVLTSSADDAFGGDTYGDGAATHPGDGQWNGIYFTSSSNPATTVMNNVIMRYGGTPALRMTNIGPTFSNMTIMGCGEGVRIEGNSAPAFNTVNIDSCGIPVRMSLVSNPAFTSVLFQHDNITALALINETIAQDLLWPIRAVSQRLNMPYYIDGTLGIGLGSTVTMQPGVIVKLRNGSIDVNRGFLAAGRTVPDSMVVFTSSRDDFYGGRSDTTAATNLPQRGDWYYVTIEGTALTASVRFHDCLFRYGGSGPSYGALRAVNSTFVVDSCIFAYNSVGASIEGSANPSITGSSIYANYYDGVVNGGTSFCTNATGNWWGAGNGPSDLNGAADVCGAGQTNAGSGDKVTNNVNYSGWASSGLQNPLLGDVSLNGQVLAYDASLVMQYVVALIPLSPLQKLVSDVSGSSGITAFDASLILQYVAGLIHAFPAISASAHPARPDLSAANSAVVRARGTFQVTLGAPRRENGSWAVPVLVTGTAPLWSLELTLAGGGAGALSAVRPMDAEVISALNAADGVARVALASAAPLSSDVVATLYFMGGEGFEPPPLAAARANENPASVTPSGVVPGRAFLALASANPAPGPVTLTLGLSSNEGGAPAHVAVYDIAGRRVRVLQDGPLAAGVHPITWDLEDESGRHVAPGLFLVHAACGTFSAGSRVMVLR